MSDSSADEAKERHMQQGTHSDSDSSSVAEERSSNEEKEEQYGIEDVLAQIPHEFRQADYDALHSVVGILKRNNTRDVDAQLEQLSEYEQQLDACMQEIVDVYYVGFNRSIRSYSDVLELIREAATSTDAQFTLTITILSKSTSLSAVLQLLRFDQGVAHLLENHRESLVDKYALEVLESIDRQQNVVQRSDALVANGDYLGATQLLVDAVRTLFGDDLRQITSLVDLQTSVLGAKNRLVDTLINKVETYIYNVSHDDDTLSLAVVRQCIHALSLLDRVPTVANQLRSDLRSSFDALIDEATKQVAQRRARLQTRRTDNTKNGGKGEIVLREVVQLVTEWFNGTLVRHQSVLVHLTHFGHSTDDAESSKAYHIGSVWSECQHALLAFCMLYLHSSALVEESADLNVSIGTATAITEPNETSTTTMEDHRSEKMLSKAANIVRSRARGAMDQLDMAADRMAQLAHMDHLVAPPRAGRNNVSFFAGALDASGGGGGGARGTEYGVRTRRERLFKFSDSSAASSPSNVSNGASDAKKHPDGASSSGGASTTLLEPSPYNVTHIYPLLMRFVTNVERVLPELRENELHQHLVVREFDTYVENAFLEHIRRDFGHRLYGFLESADSFRPREVHARADTTYSASERPLLNSAIGVDELVNELCSCVIAFAQVPQVHVQTASTRLTRTAPIDTARFLTPICDALFDTIRAFDEKCVEKLNDVVQPRGGESLVGRLLSDPKRKELLLSDPLWHDLQRTRCKERRKPVPAQWAPVSNVQRRKMEIAFHQAEALLEEALYVGTDVIEERHLLDPQKIILLSTMADTMEWMASNVRSLVRVCIQGTRQAGERNQTVEEVLRKTLQSRCEILAAHLEQLSDMCLFILRMEVRLHCFYRLQGVRRASYELQGETHDPDPFIVELNNSLSQWEHLLRAYAPAKND